MTTRPRKRGAPKPTDAELLSAAISRLNAFELVLNGKPVVATRENLLGILGGVHTAQVGMAQKLNAAYALARIDEAQALLALFKGR